ncbi:hypothetical protein PsorP6_014960 [Peronosclerospora sorghi]|uniref:Uncharacterized protein n=1 Tax=Peronosclerospora sorghi TaxID=230839 RepID=A0ACC0VRP7_9STRA|nr:hypothetical protein PsorP6_014960 [Peronosclerospora sorghi]
MLRSTRQTIAIMRTSFVLVLLASAFVENGSATSTTLSHSVDSATSGKSALRRLRFEDTSHEERASTSDIDKLVHTIIHEVISAPTSKANGDKYRTLQEHGRYCRR